MKKKVTVLIIDDVDQSKIIDALKKRKHPIKYTL